MRHREQEGQGGLIWMSLKAPGSFVSVVAESLKASDEMRH